MAWNLTPKYPKHRSWLGWTRRSRCNGWLQARKCSTHKKNVQNWNENEHPDQKCHASASMNKSQFADSSCNNFFCFSISLPRLVWSPNWINLWWNHMNLVILGWPWNFGILPSTDTKSGMSQNIKVNRSLWFIQWLQPKRYLFPRCEAASTSFLLQEGQDGFLGKLEWQKERTWFHMNTLEVLW